MSLYGNQDRKTLTGTVTVASNSATVEGAGGSAFTTEVEVGDIFLAGSDLASANRVKSITDDDTLVLTANFAGSDVGASKAAYIRETPRHLTPTDSNAIFGVGVSEVSGGQDNVVSITVSNQGSGYASAPTVTVPVPTVRTIATSAVETTDNTITSTGHNILTGTKLTYQDGSGTALAGLTDNTAYYAIKIDNDTIKLATSLSNANAGTAINLTGTGNNAQTLEGDVGAGTAVLTGAKVTSVTVTAGGSDYQSAPAATIAAPGNITFNGASAVDPATDQITISSHILLTGDKVTYTKGSNAAVVGLTTGTDYYVIKVDANTIKLATSAYNAEVGTAVDITADGANENQTLVGETATVSATLGSGNTVGSPGWVKRTVGTGGRAGRITYETLVATSSITTDAGDDIEFPDE